LKLIWFALWYGRIRFTVTLVGRDQTKGYMQRWVFHVDQPSQDFKVLRAADMLRDPLTGDHYDAVVVDDIESPEQTYEDMVAHYRLHGVDIRGHEPGEAVPVDPDIIDAVRDMPVDVNDPDGPTIRDVMPPGSVHYLPYKDMTWQEAEAFILKDWLRRHTK